MIKVQGVRQHYSFIVELTSIKTSPRNKIKYPLLKVTAVTINIFLSFIQIQNKLSQYHLCFCFVFDHSNVGFNSFKFVQPERKAAKATGDPGAIQIRN